MRSQSSLHISQLNKVRSDDASSCLSVTSSRADVSILTPIWRALELRQNVSLSILATGMHCLDADKAEGQLAGFV